MNYVDNGKGLLLPEKQELIVAGRYDATLVRKGEVIDEFSFDNLVVNQGLNALLDIMFHGSTQITTWYIGLFEGNYTPVSGVTASSIVAAATECTAYDQSTRVAFDEAAASGQSITNSASRATFTFNASKTIYGAFLTSLATKSGTTGTLFSAAKFGSSKAVESGDELLLTYTFTAASA